MPDLDLVTFILCLITIALGLGVIAGALIAGPRSYEAGWRDRGRHDAERPEQSRGFRVVS